jgi:hypothetical protein
MHEAVAGLFIHCDLPLDEHPFYTTPLHKLAHFYQIIIYSKLRIDFLHVCRSWLIASQISVYDLKRASPLPNVLKKIVLEHATMAHPSHNRTVV